MFAVMLVESPGIIAQIGSPTYSNPVLDEDFPDPSVLKVDDTWYAFGTGTDDRRAATPYIKMTQSSDLVHWSASTTVLAPPPWAKGSTWAPHVVHDPVRANRFVMFFSAKADPDRRIAPAGSDKCLGVAVASSPEGPFTPQPRPLRCGTGFFNIDPMAFRDPTSGRYSLFWGSERKPIVAQPLLADLLGFEKGSTPTPVINPIPGDKYSSLLEGSWVLDHGDYRYLFTSGANCCGGPDQYAVTVARRRLDGQGGWERFKGGDHGAILKRNDTWVAPGHNGMLVDGSGRYWMIYHARRNDGTRRRVLLIDPVDWIDDWPRIAADSPSIGPVPVPRP